MAQACKASRILLHAPVTAAAVARTKIGAFLPNERTCASDERLFRLRGNKVHAMGKRRPKRTLRENSLTKILMRAPINKKLLALQQIFYFTRPHATYRRSRSQHTPLILLSSKNFLLSRASLFASSVKEFVMSPQRAQPSRSQRASASVTVA